MEIIELPRINDDHRIQDSNDWRDYIWGIKFSKVKHDEDLGNNLEKVLKKNKFQFFVNVGFLCLLLIDREVEFILHIEQLWDIKNDSKTNGWLLDGGLSTDCLQEFSNKRSENASKENY